MKEKKKCQICGHEIKGKPYYWDDDRRLPVHPNITQCPIGDRNQAFCNFMNRNVEYLNRRGDPVLLGEEGE